MMTDLGSNTNQPTLGGPMSDQQSFQLILFQLQDLRTRMDERFDSQDKEIYSQGQRITELSTQMKSLIGNGQPGKIQIIENEHNEFKDSCNKRLGSLEQKRAEWMGKHTVISAVVASLISVMLATYDHWSTWFHKP